MIIRPAELKDLPFIKSSWVQSYRERAKLNYEIYNEFHNILVKNIVNRAMTVIACDDQDQDLIMGWLCFELYHNKPVLHYVYVKSIYRKMGVGKELFNSCIKKDFYYTHKPEINKETGHKMTYAPYLRHGEYYNGSKKD